MRAWCADTQMSIFRSGVNPTADPSQDDFKKNPVQDNFGAHANGQVDCLGFQRSPKFCDNTDKAMATGCIKVPADQPIGRCTFVNKRHLVSRLLLNSLVLLSVVRVQMCTSGTGSSTRARPTPPAGTSRSWLPVRTIAL